MHSGAFSCSQPSTPIPEPSALVCPAELATRDQVRLARQEPNGALSLTPAHQLAAVHRHRHLIQLIRQVAHRGDSHSVRHASGSHHPDRALGGLRCSISTEHN